VGQRTAAAVGERAVTRHENAPDLDAKPFPGESPETCRKVLFVGEDLRLRCLEWTIDAEPSRRR